MPYPPSVPVYLLYLSALSIYLSRSARKAFSEQKQLLPLANRLAVAKACCAHGWSECARAAAPEPSDSASCRRWHAVPVQRLGTTSMVPTQHSAHPEPQSSCPTPESSVKPPSASKVKQKCNALRHRSTGTRPPARRGRHLRTLHSPASPLPLPPLSPLPAHHCRTAERQPTLRTCIGVGRRCGTRPLLIHHRKDVRMAAACGARECRKRGLQKLSSSRKTRHGATA